MDQAPINSQEEEEEKKGKKKGPKRIKLTGATSALPIWTAFMSKALEGEPPITFRVSPHLVQLAVDRRTGALATQSCPISQVSTEVYMKAFEPRTSTCEAAWPPSTQRIEAD
jgi:membrane carboxypeptidase/penicillin-binding protein